MWVEDATLVNEDIRLNDLPTLDVEIHCSEIVEICNGVDDNCNGETDEGFDIGLPCSLGVGECMVESRIVCSEDPLVSICEAQIGPESSTEICNNLDDDCDGDVDEDSDLGCETACGIGVHQCVDGRLESCDAPAPEDEVCDFDDNNCDSYVDNINEYRPIIFGSDVRRDIISPIKVSTFFDRVQTDYVYFIENNRESDSTDLVITSGLQRGDISIPANDSSFIYSDAQRSIVLYQDRINNLNYLKYQFLRINALDGMFFENNFVGEDDDIIGRSNGDMNPSAISLSPGEYKVFWSSIKDNLWVISMTTISSPIISNEIVKTTVEFTSFNVDGNKISQITSGKKPNSNFIVSWVDAPIRSQHSGTIYTKICPNTGVCDARVIRVDDSDNFSRDLSIIDINNKYYLLYIDSSNVLKLKDESENQSWEDIAVISRDIKSYSATKIRSNNNQILIQIFYQKSQEGEIWFKEIDPLTGNTITGPYPVAETDNLSVGHSASSRGLYFNLNGTLRFTDRPFSCSEE